MRDGFRHEVLLYDGADEFLEVTVPFLEDALGAGEPALVAVGSVRADALAREIGEADGIRFVDMEALGRNPARIIPFWRDFLDQSGGAGRPVRGIGEPIWPGRSEPELDECQRHEALLNTTFGEGLGWRLLCPYDSASLDDGILEAALHCHPQLAAGGGDCEENPRWNGLGSSPGPFAGSLSPRPAGSPTFEFDRGALHAVRHRVAAHAERLGLSAPHRDDVVTAASELAANSVLHGGGRGMLSTWEDGGVLMVEVEDEGWIADPLAGRLRPDPTQVSGRGLWLANSLCDLVQIRSGPAGTTVRLQMELKRS